MASVTNGLRTWLAIQVSRSSAVRSISSRPGRGFGNLRMTVRRSSWSVARNTRVYGPSASISPSA